MTISDTLHDAATLDATAKAIRGYIGDGVVPSDELTAEIERVVMTVDALRRKIDALAADHLEREFRKRQMDNEAITALVAECPALLKKVSELELSVRAANCLRNDNIVYVGDLIRMSERELLSIPNFGRTSLSETKEALAKMGLHLGMESESALFDRFYAATLAATT
jgi:DNA-directed RNA polymerase alpha subunit